MDQVKFLLFYIATGGILATDILSQNICTAQSFNLHSDFRYRHAQYTFVQDISTGEQGVFKNVVFPVENVEPKIIIRRNPRAILEDLHQGDLEADPGYLFPVENVEECRFRVRNLSAGVISEK